MATNDSGFVRDLLGPEGSTVNVVGAKIPKASPFSTFQAIVEGDGAVTADVDIEASNDGVNWCETPLASISLTGTDAASDGFASTAPWKFVRAVVTNLTGTNAVVKVNIGE